MALVDEYDPLPIAALGSFLEHLRTSPEGIPADHREFLIDGLQRFLEFRCSLDRELGLVRHGGLSLSREAGIAWRDDLIRTCKARCEEFRSLDALAASKVMALSAERYQRATWPRDKTGSPPASEPHSTWFQILRYGLRIPRAKQLRNILEG
jgi:hypothetical protein